MLLWPCPGPVPPWEGVGMLCEWERWQVDGTSGWREVSGDRVHGHPSSRSLFLLTAEPRIQLDTALSWEGGTPAFKSEGEAEMPLITEVGGGCPWPQAALQDTLGQPGAGQETGRLAVLCTIQGERSFS